jgi:hypothetical protein
MIKLTQAQKEWMLYKFCNLILKNGIVYTEEGEEFFDHPDNEIHNLDDFVGIMEYYAYLCKKQGREDFKWEIKKIFE